jgi:hypothetical protein
MCSPSSRHNERGRVVAPADPDPDDVTSARRALRERRRLTTLLGEGPAAEARVAKPLDGDGQRLAIAVSRQLDTVRSAATEVKRAMVTAALAGLGVALLVGIALASELVRRLRRVRDTALLVARLGPVAELAPSSATTRSPTSAGRSPSCSSACASRRRRAERSCEPPRTSCERH